MNVARWLCPLLFAALSFAATDVRVDFTLNTADPYGAPLQQHRYYYVYRPDNLPKANPVPIILVLEASPNSGPATFFHSRADQAGFVVVSCSFSGNSTGTPGTQWNADNPRITGFEDYDYFTEVIRRVSASENSVDAFLTGISKGGHMTMAYACERPSTVRAVGPLDEFMGLTSNLPTAPVPLIMFQGTLDTNVPYTMVKDTLDAWRAVNGLLNLTPVATYESSPLIPGSVSRATWLGGTGGRAVAFVTIVGGTHTYPTPAVETGYDYTAGVWAFFSQFLTAPQTVPRIVSQPVDNIQLSGRPATFQIAAAGATPIGYQWQRNGVDIPGATGSWFTLTSTMAGDDGATFRAVVTNPFGSATSTAAKLSLRTAPAGPMISVQPENQAVTAGQPVIFAVSAQGAAPLSYQWRKNGVNIAGATASSYTIPAAIPADCGASFSVVVTAGAGNTTSNPATLTVIPAAAPPIILVNPVRVRLLPGQTGSFSVVAWSPSPTTYQWQKGKFTTNMADIPGATSATYTIPAATLDDHLTMFRCVVSNAAGNAASTSEMLFVTAAPTAPTQITSAITAPALMGAPFQYTVTSSGGTDPVTYSAAPLPDGLWMDAASGRISGLPAAQGDTRVRIGAANSAGSVSATLTISVTANPPAVSLDSWRLARFGASATNPSIAGDQADPDGDGYTNLDEFEFGSNPLDHASVPEALWITPRGCDFGVVPAGVQAEATFTVRDTGASSFTGAATVGGDGFTILSGNSFTIPAGGSAEVVVRFAPSHAGRIHGQIAFASNGGSAIAALSGAAGGSGATATRRGSLGVPPPSRPVARCARLVGQP